MLAWLEQHLAPLAGWAYLVIFALGFVETALFFGFVFPGESATLVGGVLAGRHVLNYWVVWGLAFTAATLGDIVGWGIGVRSGPALRKSRVGSLVPPRLWRAMDVLFERHGGRAVFIGRWISIGKALMPPTAGIARLPFRTFLFWDVLGAFTWSFVWVTLGYALAGAFTTLSKIFGWVNWIFIALFFALLIAFFVWSMRFEREVVDELNAEADAEMGHAQTTETAVSDGPDAAEHETNERDD
jgi:membrane protein DedA with SNARE-associated domain